MWWVNSGISFNRNRQRRSLPDRCFRVTSTYTVLIERKEKDHTWSQALNVYIGKYGNVGRTLSIRNHGMQGRSTSFETYTKGGHSQWL